MVKKHEVEQVNESLETEEKLVNLFLIEALKAEGQNHIFLVPGGMIEPFMPNFSVAGVEAIVACHEAGAAFMADGYARARRSFAVCMGTVVECPGTNASPMFIDCGATPGSQRAMAHDRAQTTTTVQAILARHAAAPNVVLTHGHTDHFNWIPDMLTGVTPGHIWRGGRVSDYSTSFNTWVTNQEQAGAALHEGMASNWHNDGNPLGAQLNCGPAETYVLTVNGGSNKSSRSLMLMIEYEDFAALFSGDAQQVTQDNAIRNFPDGLKTTVLSASHHGAVSAGSNNDAWVEATSPEVVVYSTGTRHRHPRCPAVARYHSRLASVPTHSTQCDSRDQT